jgi:predicted nucleic acid-binding protein
LAALKGWLLDTNVIASLIAANGAPSVKTWAAARDEDRLFLSVLTLGEYDKGIAKLAEDHPDRARYVEARDQLEARFEGRVLPVSDAVVRRWGALAGQIQRDTGHPPPVIDTLFAATAIERDLCFVTRNLKDVAKTGAQVLNPWESK